MYLYSTRLLRIAGLIGVAAGLSLFPITIGWGVHFSLAPFVYMPLVLLLPLRWAVIAAALPAAVTLLTEQQPLTMVIAATEALWLGWWSGKKRYSPGLADCVFWLLLGLPMAGWFYSDLAAMPVAASLIYSISHMGNNLLAAIVGASLVRFPGFMSRIIGGPSVPVSLRRLQMDAAFLLAIAPLLIFAIFASVALSASRTEANYLILSKGAQRVSLQLETFLEHHEAVISNLANVAGRQFGYLPTLLEEAIRAHPEFSMILIADNHGIVRQTYPLASALETRGLHVGDRDYFRSASERGSSYSSRVIRAPEFGGMDVLVISAPILCPDTHFRGVVCGVVNLDQLARTVAGPPCLRNYEVVAVDRSGVVLFADPDTGVLPSTKIDRWPQAEHLSTPEGVPIVFEKEVADKGLIQYESYASYANDGRAGVIIAQRPVYQAGQSIKQLAVAYTSIIMGVVAGALVVTNKVCKRTVEPLENFALSVVKKSHQNDLTPIPSPTITPPSEVLIVYDTFNQLVAKLGESYQELKTRNRELDQVVKDRTKQLEAALAQAEAANLSKSEFLAMTSHEIRTPLNAIIGIARGLCEDAPDAKSRESLRTIWSAGVRLLEVVNETLELNRVEAGRIELRMAPVRLGEIIREVDQIFRESARKKNLNWVVDLGDCEELWVKMDGLRLQQILINLVGNAIKFTEKGSVVLAVSQQRTLDNVCIKVVVSDTGSGISVEDQKRLFEPYFQGPKGECNDRAGSGLGLPIARRLVGLLGGELQFESEEGRGSRFFFELNTTVVEPEEHRAVGLQAERYNVRVCAVEDNAANQEVLRLILEPLTQSLTIVNSGQEAIECLSMERFDLVLMDLEMPGISGYMVMERLRKNPGVDFLRSRWVAMSAHSRDDVWARCKTLGFHDYLAKPIERSHMRKILREALMALKI